MATSAGDVVFRVDNFTNKNDSAGNESDIWDDTALIKAYDKAINSMKGTSGQCPDDEISDGQNRSKRSKRSKKCKKKKRNKWKVGDHCQAVFSEDGQLYDAVIKSINYKMATCWVTYAGYGNEEEQKVSDLMASVDINDVPPNYVNENDYDSMDYTEYTHSPLHPGSTSDRPSSRNSQHLYRGAHPGWYPPPAHFSHFPPPPPMWAMTHQTPQLHTSALPAGFPFVHMPHPANVSMGLPAVPPPPAPDTDESDESGIHSMLMAWYMSGYHTGYYQGLRQGKRLSSSNTPHPKHDHHRHREPVTEKEREQNHLSVASDSNNTEEETR